MTDRIKITLEARHRYRTAFRRVTSGECRAAMTTGGSNVDEADELTPEELAKLRSAARRGIQVNAQSLLAERAMRAKQRVVYLFDPIDSTQDEAFVVITDGNGDVVAGRGHGFSARGGSTVNNIGYTRKRYERSHNITATEVPLDDHPAPS